MKLTLGLDTATEDTAVAVTRGDETLYEELEGPENGHPRHGPALLPMVERAVSVVGGWAEVDRIAVGLGPGSFTGLRVGIATASALGYSAAIEVVGVPTLDALAARPHNHENGSLTIAALDARRGQVFAAAYAPTDEPGPMPGRRLVEPAVLDPEQIPGFIASVSGAGGAIARGSGALRFRDQFEAAGVVVPGSEDPAHRVSGRWIARIGGMTREPVEPIYLRAPDAQRWLERARNEKDES